MPQRITSRTHRSLGVTMIDDPEAIRGGYEAYLRDESRSDPRLPARIFFPESADELAAAVTEARRYGGGMTISGARTGIAGGAVSHGANLVVTDRLKRIVVGAQVGEAPPRVTCGAGVTLDEIRDALASSPYRYPVDPTETSASVGGTIATNASGSRTLRHGPTRRWVRAVTVVLANGELVELARGEHVAPDGRFELVSATGVMSDLLVRPVALPATKHNAGYHLTLPSDAIDLFIGSEGTLGVIAEASLDLIRVPQTKLGLTLFLTVEDPTPVVIDLLALAPTALEYLDECSLALLTDARQRELDGGAVPPFPAEAAGALYLELDLDSDEAVDEAYAKLESILPPHGIDLDASWAGFEESDIDAMKRFRHALPERVNAIISERKRELPGLTKIGTDMAVPIESLSRMLEIYREGVAAAGVEFCAFGHIGNGHLHVNILPRSIEEWSRGYELYRAFAASAVGFGGSVAAEHGIGRLKRSFLPIQFGEADIKSMREVKRALDPEGLLNPGVLFEE